jgi:7-carboxy-7-deazaguanine synthase
VADTLVVNEIYLSLQGESTFAGLPCVFVRLTACNLRCSYCDTAYAFTEGRRLPLAEVLANVRRLAGPYARCGQPGAIADCQLPIANSDGQPRPTATAPEWQGSTESRPTGVAALSPPETRPLPRSPSRLPLVELTGGEPLLQPAALPLMTTLCDDGFTVLVETSGALDLSGIDPRVHRIMDLKCPSSGEVARNRWENLPHLQATDEVKFVIGTVQDYEWARETIARHRLDAVCPLLFSWVAPLAPHQRHPSLKPVPAGQTPLSRVELVERIIADALPVRFQVQMHKVIWPPEQRGV